MFAAHQPIGSKMRTGWCSISILAPGVGRTAMLPALSPRTSAAVSPSKSPTLILIVRHRDHQEGGAKRPHLPPGDYLRNSREATAIAPYSNGLVRARPYRCR